MKKVLFFAVILTGMLSLKSCVKPEVLVEQPTEDSGFYEIDQDSIADFEWGGNGTGTGGGH